MMLAVVFMAVAVSVCESIECYNNCVTGGLKIDGKETTLDELANIGVNLGSAVCKDSNKKTCNAGKL